MPVFKTLNDLKKATEKKPRGDGDFTKRLVVKNGESFKIRFLQELTQDSSNYTEERGTAEVVQVVTSPLDFRKNIRSTADMPEYDFKCFGVDQGASDYRWKPKQHLLINIAVYDKETGNWEVRILDQKFTPAHVANDIVEMATEFKTLMDRDYRISRTGEKSETNYSLIPLDKSEESAAVSKLELGDLNKVYRVVPYNEQSDFFLGDDTDDTGDTGSEGW
jgi:hypothetical protein